MQLTAEQEQAQASFRSFVQEEILPHAGRWDREERLPPELVSKLGSCGYLGGVVPRSHGGSGMDMITFGLMNEAIGYGCSSVRSVLTVHSMVAAAILKWGSREQKARWLPRLAAGEIVGAFALTEPNAGSDAKSLETTARTDGDRYVLDGHKKWITYGQAADLFLVFAQVDRKPTAFLVERSTPGLEIEPIFGVLGTKASMLAEVRLSGCGVPEAAIVGRPGFGLSAVAASALDIGRYCVAWGCVGITRACLELCVEYTSERRQFDRYLKDHQLIQRLVADMVTNLEAGRLLCQHAGHLKDAGDPGTVLATWHAKYFASVTAFKAATDAVQVHGANGCSSTAPVQRHLRDAKVMEIIEGSNEIQQIMIAQSAYQRSPGASVRS